MFPSRRPDLYKASPANVSSFGIPVLYIVAPLSILVMLFLTWCTLAYPALALGGDFNDNWWQIPAFMGMIVVVGLVVFYGARVPAPPAGGRHRPRLQGTAAGVTS